MIDENSKRVTLTWSGALLIPEVLQELPQSKNCLQQTYIEMVRKEKRKEKKRKEKKRKEKKRKRKEKRKEKKRKEKKRKESKHSLKFRVKHKIKRRKGPR